MWAKIDDRFNDDPNMLALPRGVRLVHLEGIVWACRHETDGAVPQQVLVKVTDEPDPRDAVKLLVAAGLWAETETGWEIVGFLDDQRSAKDVTKVREMSKARQRRARRSQRRRSH